MTRFGLRSPRMLPTLRPFRHAAPRRATPSKLSWLALSAVADYRLLLKSSAAKELESVGSRPDRRRIIAKIAALGSDPRPQGCEKLAGYDDRYRMRRSDNRIVYLIDEHGSEVTVFKIGHRKDAFR